MWGQPWRLDGYAPAGGLTSTLEDMVRLLRAVLDGSAAGVSALDRGLFWQTSTTSHGHRRSWHGATGGYSAYVVVHPDHRTGVVILSAHSDARQHGRLADACLGASQIDL